MKNRVNLAIHKCVNTLSKFSNCEKCILSCPTDAIQKMEDNSLPKLSQSDCIECGVCIASCPTEALAIPKFSPLEYIFKSLYKKESIILDCKIDIPCLASLSIESLISLVILKKENIYANFGHCLSCDIFAKVGDQIDSQIKEANFFLETLEVENRVILENISKESSFEKKPDLKRRSIFDATIFKRDMRIFESKELKKAKDKNTPDRRKLFLMAIKRVKNRENNHILHSDDLSFISQKFVDESCTNCQICYRVCPSTALSTDYKNSFINFNSTLCLKCNLCHEVCETSSIQIREEFSIKQFLEVSSEKLIEFNILKCYECDTYFTKNGIGNLCYRCEIEESEAKELWGF